MKILIDIRNSETNILTTQAIKVFLSHHTEDDIYLYSNTETLPTIIANKKVSIITKLDGMNFSKRITFTKNVDDFVEDKISLKVVTNRTKSIALLGDFSKNNYTLEDKIEIIKKINCWKNSPSIGNIGDINDDEKSISSIRVRDIFNTNYDIVLCDESTASLLFEFSLATYRYNEKPKESEGGFSKYISHLFGNNKEVPETVDLTNYFFHNSTLEITNESINFKVSNNGSYDYLNRMLNIFYALIMNSKYED